MWSPKENASFLSIISAQWTHVVLNKASKNSQMAPVVSVISCVFLMAQGIALFWVPCSYSGNLCHCRLSRHLCRNSLMSQDKYRLVQNLNWTLLAWKLHLLPMGHSLLVIFRKSKLDDNKVKRKSQRENTSLMVKCLVDGALWLCRCEEGKKDWGVGSLVDQMTSQCLKRWPCPTSNPVLLCQQLAVPQNPKKYKNVQN